MGGQKRETERKVGAGEDGQGLDEDVGDGLVTSQVRVELVAGDSSSVGVMGQSGRWKERVDSAFR